MRPYYQDDWATIYHGDCREVLPTLGAVDLVLTDPPYGIKQDKGMGGAGYDGFGKRVKRNSRQYTGGWDSGRPGQDVFQMLLSAGKNHIIWGGQYFSDLLPVNQKWLAWDKQQTMPSYSDAELAWTTLSGNSLKMFRYCGSGLMAAEKERYHPTQKPVALIRWCIGMVPGVSSILDPFMGSGTTLRAAKDCAIKSIGIEIEERYCEIAVKRLRQEILFGEAA